MKNDGYSQPQLQLLQMLSRPSLVNLFTWAFFELGESESNILLKYFTQAFHQTDL